MSVQHELVTQAQHQEVLAALAQNSETHQKLLEALARLDERHHAMEERLRHHYQSEHKAFDALVATVDRGKFAARAIGILLAGIVALVTSVVAGVDWVQAKFHIIAK